MFEPFLLTALLTPNLRGFLHQAITFSEKASPVSSIQFSSDTNYPELGSDPTAKGSVPQTAPISDINPNSRPPVLLTDQL